MILGHYARLTALNEHGVENRKLSALRPIDAVIQCARDAGAIDDTQYEDLIHMDWVDDFSAFVPPDAELVSTTEQMRQVPSGALLAFIEVDRPPLGETQGRRHLIHAMIASGEGKAVGCRNHHICVGSANNDRWQEIDLTRDLNWLPADNSNGYDVVPGSPVGSRTPRLLRIRYRMPDDRRGAAGAGEETVEWGNPKRSPILADKFVRASVSPLRFWLEPRNDNKEEVDVRKHFWRVNIGFYLPKHLYEVFFNSPNEFRGHYYAGANYGDWYTDTLLARIAGALPWKNLIKQFGWQIDEGWIPVLRDSLRAGRIWFDETVPIWRSADWVQGDNGHVTVRYPANRRWGVDHGVRARNFASFVADTHIDDDPAYPLALRTDAKAKIQASFVKGSAYADDGASYYYTEASPDQPNIDLKGEWFRYDGTIGGFLPASKLYFAHQVKWFGYS